MQIMLALVPKPADNTNSIVCSRYELSKGNKLTHIYIQAQASEGSACREEFLCEHGSGETNQECGKYPVKSDHTNNYGCILNSASE